MRGLSRFLHALPTNFKRSSNDRLRPAKRKRRRQIIEQLESRQLLAGDIFISEYIEGSSNNKAIELYNNTGATLSLDGYSLSRYSNGGTSPSTITFTATDEIAAGDVFVIANASSDPLILAQADLTSGVISHNGDDAYELLQGTTVIDTFGVVGEDPGSAWIDGSLGTANRTLVRKSSIVDGNPAGFDPITNLSAQWDGLPSDTFSDIGSHTVGGLPDSSFVLINEILYDVPGNDGPSEYIELRGDANTAIPSGTYLLDVEGDSDSGFGAGKVSNRFDLSGLEFGSNGLLVLSQAGSGYSIDANSNSIVSSTDDFGGFSFFASDQDDPAQAGSNELENATNSFLLVSSPVTIDATDFGDDLDANDDGVLDGPIVANWTLLDSIGINDGGAGDIVYGVPAFTLAGGSTGYVGRVGNSTGNTVADWFVGEVSGTAPNFSVTGTSLNHIGATNPGDAPGGLVITESNGSTVVTEGGSTDSVDIVLDKAPTANVVVTISSADGEVTPGSTSLTFTPADWNTPQTLTFTAVDDSDLEGGQLSSIDFALASGDGAFDGLTQSLSVSVIDDDVNFKINELRISHQSKDNDSNNFIELYETGGEAGLSTDGLTLLAVTSESDTAVPPSFTAGDLNFAFDLTGGFTDANGFFLLQDDGAASPLVPGDIAANFDFFGSPSTFLLVSGYTGPLGSFISGTDLDTDETEGGDGIFDVTPWDSILDAVSLDDNDNVAPPAKNYAITDPGVTGGSVVVSTDGFTPAAAARAVDGTGAFQLTAGADTFADDSNDTPGSTNVPVFEIVETGDTTGVVEGGPTDTFSIRLLTAPTANVIFTFTIADGQTTTSTGSITFTPGNFNTAQTVTVTAVDDANDTEGLHSGLISITSSSADSKFNELSISDLVVAISDNAVASTNLKINEARISHATLDNASNNFIELYDTTGGASTSSTGLTLVVVSGAFNPGLIDFVFPLDGGLTDDDGFLLLHDDGSDAGILKDAGDLSFANLDLFGSPQTFFLVSGFTGAAGVDLDPGDDGTLDSQPWSVVFDSVSLDVQANTAFKYGSSTTVNSTDDNAPSGIRRVPDGSGSFLSLSFADEGQDTAGFTNVLPANIRIVDTDEVTNPGTDADLNVSETGLTDSFGMVLDAAPTSTVTITLDPDTNVGLNGSPSGQAITLTFTTSNWFTPQTITVAAEDDVADEGDHQGLISITAAGDATYAALTPPDVTVSIVDNDNVNHAIVINEVLKDPAPSSEFDPAPSDPDYNLYSGDANGDGTFSATQDEFVEVFNTGTSAIDISGWTLSDAAGVKHVFLPGTTLAAGQAIVVFGGGTLGTYGNSLAQTASTGGLGLSNDGDSVTLFDTVRTIDFMSWAVDGNEDLAFDDGVDQSLARLPADGTGDFLDSEFSIGQFLQTPGLTNSDGIEFEIGASLIVLESDGSTAVTEGDAVGDTVSFSFTGTPTSTVTVTLTPTDSQIDLGAGAGVATTLTFTGGNAGTPQSVVVTAVDDAVIEGSHTSAFSVAITSSDSQFNDLTSPDISVAISDNDLPTQTTSVTINEFRVNSSGGSITDFIELVGDPNSGFAGYSLVLISGEFSPGSIDDIVDLSSGIADANGFLLITDDGTSVATDPGDVLDASFNPFGSPQTILIVEGLLPTAAAGDDLDTDDDGTLDTVPWTSVLASLSIIDGDANADVNYSAEVFGPDGNFTPSGGYRTTDVTGPFALLNFADAELDTAGETNELPPIPTFIANDDVAETNVNTPVDVNVLLNDLPDGQTQILSTTNGANGTTTIGPGGLITYTPDNGFLGSDSFDYTIALNDVELTNSAVSGGDRFGNAVAIDGEYAVVGSFLDDPNGVNSAGSAFIYHRTGDTTWTQVAQLIGDGAPNGAAGQFGYSVAIDGDTVAVSAQRDRENGFQAGAVYIFNRNEGGPDNWGRVSKVVGSDTVKRDLFGRSLALSGDTLVVGASVADPAGLSSGAAYVFERDLGGADNWGQTKKLVASDGGDGDRFGQAVSIDGDLIAVGAFQYDGTASNTGAAYIFARDTGGADNWGEEAIIEAADGSADDQFAYALSIDGTRVAIGSRLDDEGGLNQLGSVYLFDQNQGGAGNWGQVTKLLATGGVAGDRLGWSVDLSGDRLVAGAIGSDIGGPASGNAYLFENVGGTWLQTRVLNNDKVTTADEYGSAVAVDASVAVVGSWLDNRTPNNSGGAYVFDLRTSTATVDVAVAETAFKSSEQPLLSLTSEDDDDDEFQWQTEAVDEAILAEL
ncbi:lamin tail domain-containing protein [Rubripirellula amarantea]|nr:lamin tail domain-containing protein [Rubripirellula amarantea]